MAQGLRNVLVRFLAPLGMVQRSVSRTLSMLDVSYEPSPLLHEDHSLRASGSIYEEDSVGLRSWMAFGDGPSRGSAPSTTRCFEAGATAAIACSRCCRVRSTLLLFVGIHETEDAYQRVADLARSIRDRHEHSVLPLLCRSALPQGHGVKLWDGPLLLTARAGCISATGPAATACT